MAAPLRMRREHRAVAVAAAAVAGGVAVAAIEAPQHMACERRDGGNMGYDCNGRHMGCAWVRAREAFETSAGGDIGCDIPGGGARAGVEVDVGADAGVDVGVWSWAAGSCEALPADDGSSCRRSLSFDPTVTVFQARKTVFQAR